MPATNTVTEKTRIEAMAFFGLSKMPRKLRKDEAYNNAILKVLKFDGNNYYVIQKANNDGKLNIVMDFDGPAIHSIVETYPIDPFIPQVKGINVKEADVVEKVLFLSECNFDFVPNAEKLGQMSIEELDELCIRVIRVVKSI